MSSDGVGTAAGGGCVCRLGERVLLAAAADMQHIAQRLGTDLQQRLEVETGGEAFAILQATTAKALEASAEAWTPVSGLDEFFKSHRLDDAAIPVLMGAIFDVAAGLFRLRHDPILTGLLAALLTRPGLPRGKAQAVLIRGHDTAIATVPSRARLAADDLVICPGPPMVVGTVQSVVRTLAQTREGERLAAIEATGPLLPGPALVVSSRGFAVLDFEIQTVDDAAEFCARRGGTVPDEINLLGIWDREARPTLGVLARRAKPMPSVREDALGLRFDVSTCLALPHGLFVSGWFVDPDGRIEEVVAIDHSLGDAVISDHWHCFPAQVKQGETHVLATRFAAFLPGLDGSLSVTAPRLRITLGGGEQHLVTPRQGQQDLLGQRKAILGSIAGYAFDIDVLETIYKPALSPLQQALTGRQAVDRVLDFGRTSSRQTSLVIPLYKEVGFIRSQLMAFNVDPFIRDHCQILYVLDDPLILLRVKQMLGGSARVYDLDITLVMLERNGGYAMANNCGVGQAAGETVVLMNSDVIPERAGWLEPMLQRLAGLPAHSAIGPKLVYADQTLQHAGMYFYRLDTEQWQNMHYFKGYGRALPDADREREVPAITGALMLLRKDDFLAVDGFTPDYVLGDYEDSDLCLKLRDRGGICLYMPTVALYHFERQSMPNSDVDQDLGSTIYNRALHTARWSATIATLMARLDGAGHAS